MSAHARVEAPEAEPAFDEAGFLREIHDFIDRELTEDLRLASRRTLGVHSDIGACRTWQQRLYRQGWIAPAWPKAWGGAGWTVRQRFLFDRACAQNDAPILFAGGIRSLGPLIIEMGTPRQKARYLKSILTGEDIWCQGFSEPGAGSDLAALTTRAVREASVYRVTGSKIWTTGAHLSNRMFAIVRTSDEGPKQAGLTFLLIDMDSPGLTVRPILGLDGEHEFNEVFFDDVRAPVENRIGEENAGWAVARRLMALARSNNTPAVLLRRVFRRAETLVRAEAAAGDPALLRRLAALAVELDAFESLEYASLPNGRPRAGDEIAPSTLKLIGSELHQRIAELAMEACGPRAAAALSAIGTDGRDLDDAARAMAKHFAVRSATVYSGSSETQRNVIARGLIGSAPRAV